MNSYRYDLMNVTGSLSDSRDKVLTHRNFNSYAEDPAAATQAWRVRRALYQTQDYINNNSDTYKRFHSGWLSMGAAVDDLTDKVTRASQLYGVNGATASGRNPLGVEMSETAESIIQTMNYQYGDQFVFAGKDGLNVPFSWNDDKTILYYRGIDVCSGGVKKPAAPDPGWGALKPENMPAAGAAGNTKLDEAWIAYYNDPANNQIPSEEPAWTLKDQAEWPAQGDPANSARDEAWLAYLKDGEAKPTDTPPSGWGLILPENMPMKQGDAAYNALDPENNEDDRITKGWVDYYTALAKGEEAEKPYAKEPDWAEPKDKYGLPESVPLQGTPEYKTFVNGLSDTEKAWLEYYEDHSDYEKLVEMSNEQLNVDLGMGMSEISPGVLVNGSAFNIALPGIKMLNFGVDEDGDPLNLAMLTKKAAEIFKNCDPSTGAYNPPEAEAVAMRLVNKLKAAQEYSTAEYVELDAKAKYLQTNQTRLEDQKKDMNEQILDIEQVDLADAITSFSWDYYCYSAALKIGNQLLSQTLSDYMN